MDVVVLFGLNMQSQAGAWEREKATVLSALEGIIGLIIGIGITIAVAYAIDIAIIIDPTISVIALVFAMLIGIFFGLLPARKASNMNPIDALRYE